VGVHCVEDSNCDRNAVLYYVITMTMMVIIMVAVTLCMHDTNIMCRTG